MKIDVDDILRWGMVAVAALVAGVGQYMDNKEEERVNDLEARLEKLESEEES